MMWRSKYHLALGGLVFLMSGLIQPGWAMSSLSDQQMSNVDGEGIAVVLENIRANMAPTSYIEAVGSPDSDPTTVASNGATLLGWGNYQYLGLTLSGTGAGEYFGGSPCTPSGLAGDLSCPIGSGAIANLAAFDNPLLIRVRSYTAENMSNNNVPNTVVEVLGPTNMDPLRLSFWTQITQMTNTGATDTAVVNNGLLQGQFVFEGKLATYQYSPLVGGTTSSNPMTGMSVRLFQVSDSNASDPNYQAMGLAMTTALSGDLRISLNQTSTSPNALNQIPVFDPQAGLFIKNAYMYLPMGGLNYQAIVFNSSAAKDGNFTIELTSIPAPQGGADCTYGNASACAQAYGLENGDSTGYQTAMDARTVMTGSGSSFGNNVSQTTSYYQTHGYIDFGLYNPPNPACASGSTLPACSVASTSTTAPTAGSTTDGIYFASGNNYQDQAKSFSYTEIGFNTSGSYSGLNCASAGNNTCPSYSNQNCESTWCVVYSSMNYTTGGVPTGGTPPANVLTVTQGTTSGSGNTVTTTNPSGSGYNPGIINLGTAHMDGILINHLSLTTLGAGH